MKLHTLCLPLLLAAACGTPPKAKPAPEEPAPAPPSQGHGPSIAAEVGALDEEAVKTVMDDAMADVHGCLASGQKAQPLVSGDIVVVVRVAHDGSCAYAYPKSSTLAHAETERCIVDALKSRTWPKPQGGEEGQAVQSFGIDARGRAPVEWSPEDLGEGRALVDEAIANCQHGSPMTLTMLVDPDGTVISAGASISDVNDREAAACAVQAVTAVTGLPSPGSFAAKLALKLD